jgi:predicted RNA-binding Zn ribbon-like protein
MSETIRTLENLEIVGGVPCLDVANTVNSRLSPEHDYLTHYADLVAWANKVGILSRAQASQLQKRAKQDAEEAGLALETARTLRELIFRIFSNNMKDSESRQEDIEFLVQMYAEAISHSRFVQKGNHYVTAWEVDRDFDALLWPIIHSAGELLLSEKRSQVKECPGCGWLFLDTSKNQSRRWCSMNTCGARDKMRRYHRRRRAK